MWAILGILLSAAASEALITRPPSLAQAMKENQFILLAKVDQLFPEKPAVVLVVQEDLKGKASFRRLPVNLTGDAEAEKYKHTPQLLKRLAPGLPLVLFASQRGPNINVFGFTNGTWFQMDGKKGDNPESQSLAFRHCEPYLRRTFKGTTVEMRQAIVDGLSGTKQPPPPDEKEPPGLGPEVEPQKRGVLKAPASQLFAVIPTLGVGGPLAILALLFPSVFGGVLILFRQWLAFFTVLGLNSTLYLLHLGFGDVWFRNTWWSSPTALWFVLTMVTAVGALWAWRRHYRAAQEGQVIVTPQRTEHIFLWFLSVCCAGVAVMLLVNPPEKWSTSEDLFVVFASGICVATLYKTARSILNALRAPPKLPMPTESVILGTVMLASIGIAAARPGVPGSGGSTEVGEHHVGAGDRPVPRLLEDRTWSHWFNQNGTGSVFASPVVSGNRVYMAAAHGALNRFGVLYCVDLKTQKNVWIFDNDGDMKQIYSTPHLVDGRVFIGEGFHEDKNCRLFCIDVETGKKIWDFPTSSHTESTPVTANGKVYFGAGDDGIYCLDAATGKKLWQFPDPQFRELHFHVDASPAVADGKVYVGGGIDEDTGEGDAAIACLDAETGRKIWLVRTDLPSWAAPVVAGQQVFFALGNGRITDSTKRGTPAGALLCVDPQTGKELWPRYPVGDGILKRPAVDSQRVYFGSRDGFCYCVGRFDGKLQWRVPLGSPVVASPALAPCNRCGHSTSLFTITTEGRITCLEPDTGNKSWTYRFDRKASVHTSSSPQVVVQVTPEGERRWIYFGVNLENFSTPALYRLEDLLPDRK
jgi:outer membrane protein assembly factor BamB